MAERVVVPIFPLPEITFFPHTVMPLHVFEARYRAMVVDSVERGKPLAIVQLKPGYEATYAGKPDVHPIAGAGPIASAERLATGRYNILVKGEWRLRLLRELPSDTLYRLFEAEKLVDVEPSTDVAPTLDRIRAACRRLLRALDRPPTLLDTALADGQPAGVIADRIAAAVLPGAPVRQELLETIDVTRRLARLADALDQLISELRGGRG